MTRKYLAILGLTLLMACDGGSPLVSDQETDDDQTTDPVTPINSDRELPPGTAEPTPNNLIVRHEALDNEGGGYARNIEYRNDQGQDEFFVDNLAFDGDNVYTRGGTETAVNAVGQLGAFAVYEAAETTEDPVTGNTIGTFTYRAIYGRSTTGETEFAIVRTGSYIDYGFGGFIYQRNDRDDNDDRVRLVLPEEGDAHYLGDYAGIRIFNERSGLEYVDGDAEMFVDFKDFNNGNRGVALFVNNRRIYDIDGNDVTQAYLTALNEAGNGGGGGLLGGGGGGTGASLIVERDEDGNVVLPSLNPIISPSDADSNGEIVAGIQEISAFDDGTTNISGEGSYYAIMSGSEVGEIVGVLVITGDDPRVDGSTYQETGGFIVYRQ